MGTLAFHIRCEQIQPFRKMVKSVAYQTDLQIFALHGFYQEANSSAQKQYHHFPLTSILLTRPSTELRGREEKYIHFRIDHHQGLRVEFPQMIRTCFHCDLQF